MRRTAPGVNYALAAAVRKVNALYFSLPEPYRPEITGERWDALEAEIDARCGAGDRQGALRAIAAWQDHAERVLSAAMLAAPLEEAA